MILQTRRGFLGLLTGAIAAPLVVRPEHIMPVRSPKLIVIDPIAKLIDPEWTAFPGHIIGEETEYNTVQFASIGDSRIRSVPGGRERFVRIAIDAPDGSRGGEVRARVPDDAPVGLHLAGPVPCVIRVRNFTDLNEARFALNVTEIDVTGRDGPIVPYSIEADGKPPPSTITFAELGEGSVRRAKGWRA